MSRRGTAGRTRRSADEWSALISEQAGSGQSQRAFCESRGLSLSSFGNAKRRLVEPPREEADAGEFVAIPLVQPAEMCWDVELSLGDGVVLRLRRA